MYHSCTTGRNVMNYSASNIVTKFYFYIAILLFVSACGEADSLGNATGNSTGINVNNEQSSISLTWTPPSINTDGSTLNDLSGYKIYYGPSPDQLTEHITIENGSIADYTTDQLNIDLSSTDTYYFGMKAYNSLNLESPMSNIVSKQFI